MAQIGTISKHACHVKFQSHKLALFSKHSNLSFRLSTLKCTQKKPTTFPFCPREQEEEESQVQAKFFFTWQYPPPPLQ
jgi:hypothetical protein